MYYHRRLILPLFAVSALLVAATVSSGCADERKGEVKKGKIELVLDDFSVTPTQIVSSSRTITFTVRNEGRKPHNLKFLRQGEWDYGSVGGLGPGESKEVTLEFKPDKYKMVSTLGNDENLGLYGTLFVKSGKLANQLVATILRREIAVLTAASFVCVFLVLRAAQIGGVTL